MEKKILLLTSRTIGKNENGLLDKYKEVIIEYIKTIVDRNIDTISLGQAFTKELKDLLETEGFNLKLFKQIPSKTAPSNYNNILNHDHIIFFNL